MEDFSIAYVRKYTTIGVIYSYFDSLDCFVGNFIHTEEAEEFYSLVVHNGLLKR